MQGFAGGILIADIDAGLEDISASDFTKLSTESTPQTNAILGTLYIRSLTKVTDEAPV